MLQIAELPGGNINVLKHIGTSGGFAVKFGVWSYAEFIPMAGIQVKLIFNLLIIVLFI